MLKLFSQQSSELNEVDWIEWAAPNTASQPRLLGKPAPSDYAAGEQLQVAAMAQDANSPGVFPNDEYFPKQWHLHNTGQSGGTPVRTFVPRRRGRSRQETRTSWSP